MIIKTLALSHFGKFHHKTVKLKNGINLIYGNNESGKTTLHAFIKAMLVGIDMSRVGEEIKETYSKYLPWDSPFLYSGTMDIEVGGCTYRIVRNFYEEARESQVIDLNTGRSITLEEAQDLPMLNGVNYANYQNTISIEQLKPQTDQLLVKIVKDYYTNLTSSRNGNIHINKSFKLLEEEEKEIEQKQTAAELQLVEEKLSLLRNYKLELQNIEKRITQLQESEGNKEEESKLRMLEKQLRSFDEKAANYQMIKEQIEEYEFKLNEQMKYENANIERFENKWVSAGLYGLLVLACMLAGFSQQWLLAGICMLTIVGFFVGKAIYLNKINSKENSIVDKGESYRLMLYTKEQALLEELSVYKPFLEMETMPKTNITETMKQNFDNRIAEYRNKIETNMLVKEKELVELKVRQKQLQKELTEFEHLSKEKKIIMTKKQKEQQQLMAIGKAKIVIEQIMKKIQDSYGKIINQQLSKNVSVLTNCKYNRVFLDDNLNIYVESSEKTIPLEQLSTGTIHQVYFALRMVFAGHLFPKIKLPLVLDETFVYYDDERIMEVLKHLPKDRQIIILTCQEREKRLLDALDREYNLIRL